MIDSYKVRRLRFRPPLFPLRLVAPSTSRSGNGGDGDSSGTGL